MRIVQPPPRIWGGGPQQQQQQQTRMRPGLGAGSGMQRRRRGSVRPEQPERTVTMSFSIAPTESQRQNRAPSSAHTATDPDRHQLRPPAARCPGEREGLWHRRTLFWRTSSGVQVVSPARRSEARCGLGFTRTRTLLEYCALLGLRSHGGFVEHKQRKVTFPPRFIVSNGVYCVSKSC
ncbi:hypothetical protein Q8A73_017921 [Channa argus]|nr:hypothetical protein Q8A73_017921 [Channa argus]